MDITVEFALKNSTECIYRFPNSKITQTGESNYEINIIVRITLKNRSWTYIIYPYNAIATKIIINNWNDQIDILVEFTVKNETESIYILSILKITKLG